MLEIKTSFNPIRILAHMRNEVEMNIEITNAGLEPRWLEADVVLNDEVLSLAPDTKLQRGRLRVGIAFARESKTTRCKIFANSSTYPGNYKITIIAYGFDKGGVIADRREATTELRCERIA